MIGLLLGSMPSLMDAQCSQVELSMFIINAMDWKKKKSIDSILRKKMQFIIILHIYLGYTFRKNCQIIKITNASSSKNDQHVFYLQQFIIFLYNKLENSL